MTRINNELAIARRRSSDRLTLGEPVQRLPLEATPHIVPANASRLDWNSVLPSAQCSYVPGNPPFIEHTFQSVQQKIDQDSVLAGIHGSGVLDFVCSWNVKAAQYISGPHSGKLTHPRVSFRAPSPGTSLLLVPLRDQRLIFLLKTNRWRGRQWPHATPSRMRTAKSRRSSSGGVLAAGSVGGAFASSFPRISQRGCC